ncbi:hypothetical protein [Micromonospora chalcea]|uniref:hypothetical protein n=1 Tax=Micromonospora chalcea TaxID=1874 RepID=UPI0011B01ED6|nr:hypothetical protein [Micromonospora chalcea]
MRLIAEPFLRNQISTTAAAVARRYSVDQHSAALDEIQLAVGILHLQDDRLGTVEAETVVKLTVDDESRKLQETRLSQQRLHQLRVELEKAYSAALRDEIFTDGHTALSWLVIRFPELATVGPGEVISTIIEEARLNGRQPENSSADERQQAMADLVTWLASNDTDGPRTALGALDFVLEKLGEDRLRQRLRALRNQNSGNVEPGDQYNLGRTTTPE